MYFKDNYEFLGNFYECPMTMEIDGKECKFLNVEAAYQAQKVPDIADRFSAIKGLQAKRMDDLLKIKVPDWEHYKLFAMANALHAKFSNKFLLNLLKAIKEDIIHDNYWRDTFWGVYKGEGKNILGKMLMNIRDNNNDLQKLYDYINNTLIKIV